MEQLQEKRINYKTAGEIPEVSVRQMKRLLRAFRGEGAAGLAIEAGREAESPSIGTRKSASGIGSAQRAKCGLLPTLAHEQMVERSGMG